MLTILKYSWFIITRLTGLILHICLRNLANVKCYKGNILAWWFCWDIYIYKIGLWVLFQYLDNLFIDTNSHNECRMVIRQPNLYAGKSFTEKTAFIFAVNPCDIVVCLYSGNFTCVIDSKTWMKLGTHHWYGNSHCVEKSNSPCCPSK